mgnify:CR=1 FL=1
MIVENGGPPLDLDEAVLFPYDNSSVPLRYLLQPGLVPSTNPYKPHPKVLEAGGPEAPDHLDVKFYGTVIRIGDELHMWYIGKGEENGKKRVRTSATPSARMESIGRSPSWGWWSSMETPATTW